MAVGRMRDERGEAHRRGVVALAAQINEFAAEHDINVHACRPSGAVLVHVGHVVDLRPDHTILVLLPLFVRFILHEF